MKNKIITSLMLSSIALGGTTGTVFAESDFTKTQGDVTFIAGDTPGVVDPTDPTDPVDPTDPIDPIIVDNIALTHAPTFSFGQVKINPLGEEYPVLESQFKDVDSTPFYRADFVQVADISGNANATWNVSVAQDDVFTKGGDSLPNTRIRLYGNTVTNSNVEPGTDLLGITLGGSGYSEIPVGSTGVTVLESKTAGFTNASISSSVFEDNHVGDKATTQTTNDGVKLSVPKGDTPKTGGAYTADLTWTLSVTP